MNGRETVIAFVYLGGRIPKYVLKNASRVAVNSGLKTYLFVEGQVDFAEIEQIGIRNFELVAMPSVRILDRTALSHEFEFRNGFWFLTLERLLILKRIHEYLGSGVKLLHVEGDMMLMPSFPFKDIFRDKLMWFRHNVCDDVGSLVYSPSLESSVWLHDRLLEQARKNPQITDMSALCAIREQFPEKIDSFPSLFEANLDERNLGTFDGLSLGQWLLGIDPRNTFGFTILHENNSIEVGRDKTLGSFLNHCEFSIEGNNELKVSVESTQSTLHCLHVHSKEVMLFELENQNVIRKYVELSKNKNAVVENFNSQLFFELLWENLRKGKFLDYMRNFAQFLRKRDSGGTPRYKIIFQHVIGLS